MKPDVSSVDAVKAALVNAKSMSYYPQSASGAYFASLFDRLGIPEAKSRLMPMKGKKVMDAVATGEAELTIITLPNLMDIPGIEVAGLLPEELQNYTVFAAGICASTQQAERAKAYLSFLKTAEVAAVMKKHGLDAVGP